MSLIFATIPSKRLAQSITSVSTTFYINNIIGFNTTDSLDVDDTDLGTQHFCVFRNDTGTKIEIMEIDPATIGTGPITILRRGLSYYGDLTTEVTANKLDWSANETVVNLGTDSPQIFQWLKEYIDNASVAGAVNASTTAKGIVEEATQAEADARTVTGATGAKLFVPLDKIRATKYHDYAADAGSNDTYAITVTPAPTAYATGQVFTFKANTANTGASTLNVNSLGAKTIVKDGNVALEDNDIKANQNVIVQYDGTNMQLLSRSNAVTKVKFGGTGADGALSISSGTTTVDLAGARLVTLNYTSISITGTGVLAFSNPHANGTIIVIKCSGNCTLTSSAAPMIDCRNTGAAGGAGATRTSTGNDPGASGTPGHTYGHITTNAGGFSSGNAAGAGGAIGSWVLFSGSLNVLTSSQVVAKYPRLFVGGGGGGGGVGWASGGSGSVIGGTGGNGGGCLIMEIAGAINFTTTGGISVSGSVGGNGSVTGNPTNYNAHSGGGGGGGSAFILYNTLTAFSGTITSAGGLGGNTLVGGSGAGNNGSPGGGGSAIVVGQTGSTNITVSGKTGGDGGAGLAVNELNTEYA